MNLQKRLSTEELAIQIAFSHNLIRQYKEDWEELRALATWRVEIFDWVKQADNEEINLVLTFLQKEYPVAYLEVVSMVTEYKTELKSNSKRPITKKVFDIFYRIKNKIATKTKKEGDYEKVCSNSPVYLRRDIDGYGDTGPTTSSGPIHG